MTRHERTMCRLIGALWGIGLLGMAALLLFTGCRVDTEHSRWEALMAMTSKERALTKENEQLRGEIRALQTGPAPQLGGGAAGGPNEAAQLRAELAAAKRALELRGQEIADAMGRHRGTEPLVEAVKRLASDYHTLLIKDMRPTGEKR